MSSSHLHHRHYLKPLLAAYPDLALYPQPAMARPVQYLQQGQPPYLLHPQTLTEVVKAVQLVVHQFLGRVHLEVFMARTMAISLQGSE
jgi:hypothetical protein